MTGMLGAVLAGGASRRFGSDKALAEVGGKRLIDHAIAALAARCDAIVICGRTLEGFATVADRPAPGLGPLGGLAGALGAAVSGGYQWVLSVPCDVPDLPGDLFERLVGEGGGAAAYARECPVVGLWPAGLGTLLEAHLGSGERSMRSWIARIEAVGVDWPAPLSNINTPDDLRRIAG
ncbi:molybdenum cofactor guanylyltransferase [Sphingomonas nostoxanthinifaciens]|uniref:molybdenum cofactor guanylyltransferase n=1 Tax=Sphingomonas nostoxanthinifaciens TaxID=2872652 RepID=UPI001CC1F590|nr:NTP transferase domain-containing protein [Sphingomonas nostoxanthinifaciens]UAK23242.1 NTP transferase domain-containing protein [Sphingomonas nostoxanthinifaciens]